LSRLRGVFQAVATLALVQIVLSATQNWVSLTNGALGVNGIPKVAGTGVLLSVVVVVVLLLVAMGRYSVGRAMDVIREDETVAVSLGISVPITTASRSSCRGCWRAWAARCRPPAATPSRPASSASACSWRRWRWSCSVAAPRCGARWSALPS
jgi:hypothetical protein